MKKSLVMFGLCALALSAGAAQAANSLTVNGACALGGSYGLQVTKSDGSSDAFVRSDEPTDETHFRVKFLFDGNSMDIPAPPNDYFQFLRTGWSGVGTSLILFVKQANSGNYRITTYARREGGGTTYVLVGEATVQVIGGPPKTVEVEWQRGAPGYVKVWLGTANTNPPTYQRSDINNPTTEVDTVRWGVFNGDGGAVTGTFCLDEYESYR